MAALTGTNSLVSSKSFQTQSSLASASKSFLVSNVKSIRSVQPISAVHSPEPSKNPIVSDKLSKTTSSSTAAAAAAASSSSVAAAPAVTKQVSTKWNIESWKTKKALQLPEYPDKEELQSVLETLDAFPPLVFAGEARHLEEKLGEAAMGNAFLLQGGDCAESFKEFNANNIRDTFRILLQMGAVLMFGGQMPVIKVSFLSHFFASYVPVLFF